ncbi:hypothetical protein ACFXPY_32095 [Streptomyces sp. NPDC059153]|uniref:hypothetical protein n=1 Tax=Streptomyces sp. NPDC059153 TaxID=3346743 RepID=UPI0036A37F42
MGSNELADKVAQLITQPGPLDMVPAGDPVLRQKTAYYEGQLDDDVLRNLIVRMSGTMEQIQGAVGLVAPGRASAAARGAGDTRGVLRPVE